MTDEEFTEVLQKCGMAFNRYAILLRVAEEEYEKRYGCLPGDHDNDSWVDSLGGGCGDASESVTAAIVDRWARECRSRRDRSSKT